MRAGRLHDSGCGLCQARDLLHAGLRPRRRRGDKYVKTVIAGDATRSRGLRAHLCPRPGADNQPGRLRRHSQVPRQPLRAHPRRGLGRVRVETSGARAAGARVALPVPSLALQYLLRPHEEGSCNLRCCPQAQRRWAWGLSEPSHFSSGRDKRPPTGSSTRAMLRRRSRGTPSSAASSIGGACLISSSASVRPSRPSCCWRIASRSNG